MKSFEDKENYYYAGLIKLLKDYKPKKSKKANYSDWFGFWRVLTGYCIAHLVYMSLKFPLKFELCLKEIQDETNDCFIKAIDDYKPQIWIKKEKAVK